MQELLSSHTHCQPPSHSISKPRPNLAPPNACTLSKPHFLISRPITGYANSPCCSRPAFRSRKLEPLRWLSTQDEASLYPGPDENTIERSGREVVRAKNTSKRDQITRRRQHSSESPQSTACENGREAWIWTHSHSRAMILLCFRSPPSAFAASSLPPHTNHSGRSHSQGAFAGTGGPPPGSARPGQARGLRLAGRGRPFVATRRVTRPGPGRHVVNSNYYPASWWSVSFGWWVCVLWFPC
jgi:hypothetical protein